MDRKYEFREHISPFLKEKIEYLNSVGRSDDAHKLELQYKYDEREELSSENSTNRHYEADTGLSNIERLYAHHCCVEINFICSAHCRYCLRSNYTKWTIDDEGIREVVDYVKNQELTEILITGGDPFLTPHILKKLGMALREDAKTLKILRIATRVMTQNPDYVNENKNGILDVLRELRKYFRIEIATQINTWVELDDSRVESAFDKLHEIVNVIYSQNVFLKGVNDTGEELIKLYTKMRNLGIEAHYLFHCCDIKGCSHLRTSVHDMVRAYETLVNSGAISGRCKPMMALMTGIGKIILTDLNAIEYKGDSLLLRSRYKYEDRIKYNPEWKLPKDAFVDKDGFLWIEYRGEALQYRYED